MIPESGHGKRHYPVPVADFCFDIYTDVAHFPVHTASAEIVLVIEGRASLQHSGGEVIHLNCGQSAFIPASTGDWTLTLSGRLCRVYG
jgi:mannose-6-phosphate isomerase